MQNGSTNRQRATLSAANQGLFGGKRTNERETLPCRETARYKSGIESGCYPLSTTIANIYAMNVETNGADPDEQVGCALGRLLAK
ncbi:hypothetical protein [Paraburkholderia bannensis]|uniref:hypothetical protein n=1 Tax=Paraburkholderia bannensis TaxID=765414 RepID=UPI002AC31591|nr:hypothetical protein [Paraburkholderia bannensis]